MRFHQPSAGGMPATGMGGPLHMMPRIARATTGMMMRRSGKRGAQRGFPYGKAGDQDREEMSGKGARRT